MGMEMEMEMAMAKAMEWDGDGSLQYLAHVIVAQQDILPKPYR